MLKPLRWLRFGCFVPWLLMTTVAFVSAAEIELRTLVEGNTAFAVDWYHQLRNTEGNIVFLPYSVSSALVIAAEGARGETALEMGEVLHFPGTARREENQAVPWETADIQAGMAALKDRITGGDESFVRAIKEKIVELREAHERAGAEVKKLSKERKWQEHSEAIEEQRRITAELNAALAQVDQYKLSIANAFWGERTYPFRSTYIDTITRYYGEASVHSADFINGFPTERARINRWVADHTEDRIKDIIPELSPDEAKLIRLIITNAIYFKGEWSEPFHEGRTTPESFFLADGGSVLVPMMQTGNREKQTAGYAAFNHDGSFFDTPRRYERDQTEGLYPDQDGFAILDLPYKGEDLAMTVIAPNSPDGLAVIENKLSSETLALWFGELQERYVKVFLPRFKLETDYAMKTTLERLGMVRAFRDPRLPDGADFTGMSDTADPRDGLYLSKVLHKAFVEVNEKGTEAAAATALILAVTTSVPTTYPFTPTFRADRSFLFFIRSRATGSILFMGRVVNPDA